MIRKGLKTRIRKVLLSGILLMFVISTIYWGFKISNLVDEIQSLKVLAGNSELPDGFGLVNVFAALALVNYVVTDGVVLWRGWVLCSMDYRRPLYFPLFFLVCCCFTVTSTIAVRIALEIVSMDSPVHRRLVRAIDVCQVANLGFSLIVNLSTTMIIALKTWRFRRWIITDLQAIEYNKRTRGERVLVLLIESGLLYCISGITVLVSSLIRLPVGTLGDIYTPVNIQIAGIYPIVVLLLVSRGQSLDQTVFNRTEEHRTPRTRESELDSMRFHVRTTMARPELSLRLTRADGSEEHEVGKEPAGV
ncbi:hypothetical protein VNI00_008168 [Paramarasmius palmivorus]|uniref:Uncharacterized protein n=1 Tax=Paramarasmius palmivorus TaxID=297713 RepID=A0AAW0CXP8_9AGAR